MKGSWQAFIQAVVLALTFLVRPSISAGCLPGWFEFSDYCYLIKGVDVASSKSWAQAYYSCHSSKPTAYLVSIHTQTEQSFVADLLQGNASNIVSLYIGINSRGSQGGYQWSDKSPVSYTHWKPGFITAQGKDCVAIDTATGYWIDQMCDDITGYICKMRNPTRGITPTQPPPSYSAAFFCDSGWHQYGSFCYQYKSVSLSYSDAHQGCTDHQSDLAVIHSIFEQAFLLSIVQRGLNIWIGLNDKANEGEYTWVDASNVVYTNWGYGEPNSKSDHEDCVVMNSTTSHWSDVECSEKNLYICRKVAGSKSSPVVNSSCSSGWVSFNGHCYLLYSANSTVGLNYTEAKSHCHEQGAYLVHINNMYENAFLTAQFPLAGGDRYHHMWVGLNDMQTEGLYEWTDGKPVTFTSWRPHQPDNYHHFEDCVEMFVMPSDRLVDGLWNDNSCEVRQGYICEKRPDTAPPTHSAISTTSSSKQCSTGWLKWQNYCYKFDIPIRLTWMNARERCVKYGADLVSLHSVDEVSFVIQQAQSAKRTHSLWIGLNDRNVEGGYVWSDGSPVFFTHWNNGLPNNWLGQQDCVEMLTSRHKTNWNDIACNQLRNFACKMSIFSSPTLWNSTLPPYYNDSCPNEWVAFGPFCYAFFGMDTGDRKTWNDAQKDCQTNDANLTSITSLNEQEFISSYILSLNDSASTSSMWIGLNDVFKEGTYQWVDKATLSFSYWRPGQPNNARSQDCGTLVNGQFWDDDQCSKRHSYVCKQLRAGATLPSYNIPKQINNGFCPSTGNWVSIGGWCYLANSTRLNWIAAERYCVSVGAHLTSLLTNEEATAVVNRIIKKTNGTGNNVWIGLNDRENEHSYVWTDGMPVLITSWYQNQPSDYGGEQNCVYLNTGQGRWNDQYCTVKYPFVCKRNKIPYPTTVPPTVVTSKVPIASCDQTYNQLGRQRRVICFPDCAYHGDYPVWGWQIYTDDSSVCRAAIQSGLLENKGAVVDVIDVGSHDVFTAYNANRVTSSAHGTSDAFTFKFSSPPPCPLGWIQHNFSCYQIVPSVDDGITAVSWQAAQQKCEKQDGYLVVISSERERSYLQSQLPPATGQLWIGLNDVDEEGSYIWMDGSPLSYHFWAQGQPHDVDHSENCVEMDPNGVNDPGAWRDTYCNSHKGYICEKLLVNESVPTIGPTSALSSCPNGTLTFGPACYVISPSPNASHLKLDWNEARAACRAANNGSNLISIHSLAELQFFRQWMHQLDYRQVWIGLNDIEVEGRYVWSDNSSVSSTVLYWEPQQPDDTHHSLNCVAFNTADGMFPDEDCQVLLPYACKFARSLVLISGHKSSDTGLSAGVIAVIVIAAIVLVVVAVILGICFVRRRRRRRLPQALSADYSPLSKDVDDDDDDMPVKL